MSLGRVLAEEFQPDETLEGTLLTSWTNWHTERESGGRKVCRGKQDSIVQGPCTT